MRLRQLAVVLKQNSGVSDGQGGVINEWEPGGNLWATAEHPSPQQVSAIDAPDWIVYLRKGTDVSVGDRLQFATKTVSLEKERGTPYGRGYRMFNGNEIQHNG